MRDSLKNKAVTAVKWNYVGNAAKAVFQFVVGIALARLLSPADFGLAALAWMLIGFGALFADFGLSSAIVQKDKLSDDDVAYAFTLQIAVGFALTALLLAAALPIATFFKQPLATPVIQVLAPMFLIRSLGQTSYALLTRDLKFSQVQLSAVASYAVGYGIFGIGLAYAHFGVWSLVYAQLIQNILNSALLIFQKPIIPRFKIRHTDKQLGKFGAYVVTANIASYAVTNLDGFFIGHFFGAFSLGIYNRTMNLVGTPMGALTTGIQSALFSSAARAANRHDALRRAYTTCLLAIAFALAPLLMTMGAVPQTVVVGLFGEHWKAAAPVLPALSVAMLVNALLAFNGPILMAIGRAEMETQVQVVVACTLAAALTLFTKSSLVTIAWLVAAIYTLRMTLLMIQIYRTIGINFQDIVDGLMRIAIWTLITSTSVYILDRALSATLPSTQLLFTDVACAALVSSMSVLIFPKIFIPKSLRQFISDFPQIPPLIRERLR